MVSGGGIGPPRIKAEVILKNYGRTPAYNLRVSIAAGVGTEFKPQEAEQSARPVGTLGPGAAYRMELIFALSTTDFQRVRAKELKLFVHGRADYGDAFRNDARWMTYRLISAAAYGGEWGQLISDVKGNDSDRPE